MKLFIFDLDGTLVDSTEDIARSVNELLEASDRASLPTERIRTYIGNGVRRLLERALGDAEAEELDRAEEIYLSIYRRRLLETTRPYPGVEPALRALHEDGERVLAVLTNKPLRESLLILDGLGLSRYFLRVYGGDSFPRKKPDPMGVIHLLEEVRASAGETLFVGDSSVDLETARNASVRSCLVVYPLPVPPPAVDPRPDFEVRDLREILSLVDTPPASGDGRG
jgi:phosphoglycolate phosphatase